MSAWLQGAGLVSLVLLPVWSLAPGAGRFAGSSGAPPPCPPRTPWALASRPPHAPVSAPPPACAVSWTLPGRELGQPQGPPLWDPERCCPLVSVCSWGGSVPPRPSVCDRSTLSGSGGRRCGEQGCPQVLDLGATPGQVERLRAVSTWCSVSRGGAWARQEQVSRDRLGAGVAGSPCQTARPPGVLSLPRYFQKGLSWPCSPPISLDRQVPLPEGGSVLLLQSRPQQRLCCQRLRPGLGAPCPFPASGSRALCLSPPPPGQLHAAPRLSGPPTSPGAASDRPCCRRGGTCWRGRCGRHPELPKGLRLSRPGGFTGAVPGVFPRDGAEREGESGPGHFTRPRSEAGLRDPAPSGSTGFPGGPLVENQLVVQETQVPSWSGEISQAVEPLSPELRLLSPCSQEPVPREERSLQMRSPHTAKKAWPSQK